MLTRVLSIFLIAAFTCVMLVLFRSSSPEPERSLASITGGIAIGTLYAIVARLILRTSHSGRAKQNLIVLLNCILGVLIFGLATILDNQTFFRLNLAADDDFTLIVFSGGFFGLFMGVGVVFDYALMNRTPLRLLYFSVVVLGFFMMFAWYSATRAFVFIGSIVISRVASSIVLNHTKD